MSRILISASQKSSGKTTISVGLAHALAARGLRVQTFKKGPDYIDPMWLARASGRPCYNLDFNTQARNEIRCMFADKAHDADLALVEGNMGLHDGVDPEGSDSTAALARLIGAPVIMVIDCEGMMRGVAPLLLGFQAFDTNVHIAGVILNRVASLRQQNKITAALQRYTSVPILGALPRDATMTIVERHLGLTTPAETRDELVKVGLLAAILRDGVDLDRVLEIALGAGPVVNGDQNMVLTKSSRSADVTIAVARDSAFGFYYTDDMEAFERAGARVVPFSPLSDAQLPRADGIFIGGGFPENHMAALEANTGMRAEIRRLALAGMPIYAECGGLMYLARSIRWGGETRQMAGVVSGDVVVHERPQGRGLVVLGETCDFPWPQPDQPKVDRQVWAHEFHHAEMINIAADSRFAWSVVRGAGIVGGRDGIVTGNVLASFSHLRDTSAHHWTERFAAFVRHHKVVRDRRTWVVSTRIDAL
jgi:cobyrinic acid a,c-diamide synthase